jgi:Lipid A 3-O-deacylase (PagL)
MSSRRSTALAIVLLVLSVAAPAAAFDPEQTYAKGTLVVSPEASYGWQFNFEDKRRWSHIEFWNAGVRVSLLPLGTSFRGTPLYGALETGLEPIYQRYTEPHDAFFAGLGAVGRYHFLGIGRLVPYVEAAGFVGGTDLRVFEIRSDFAFMVFGGVGTAFFVTDHAALYGGYRWEHLSNGNTSRPNRGFESHVGVAGVSFFLP